MHIVTQLVLMVMLSVLLMILATIAKLATKRLNASLNHNHREDGAAAAAKATGSDAAPGEI